MTKRKVPLEVYEEDRPMGWARGYISNPDLREFHDMGLIDCSLEGLVRFDTNKGSIQRVEISERAIAEALVRISDHRFEKEFMILALQAVAQSLFGLDRDYRLELVQNRPGKIEQLPDRRRRDRKQRAIVATIEQAKASGQRSGGKVAARLHGCSPSTVTRANRAIKKPSTPSQD